MEEPADTEALTCTLPEDEKHTHTALCYGTWELTCDMEEHTHTEECSTAEETEATEETEETESAEPETVEEIEEFEETIEEPEEEPEPEPSEPIELAMPVYTAEELLQKAHAAGDDPKVIEDPATGITILDYSDIL